MKPINEEKIVANLYLNLKGGKKKRDNWIDIANDLRRLKEHYGSLAETAQKLDVSYELVRSILNLLKLPEKVQQMIRENRILYDAAQRLQRLDDPKKQIEVANAIDGMKSHEAREIIQYAKKYPHFNLENFKKRVIAPKVKSERVHLTILPLRERTYELLYEASVKKAIRFEKFILDIIEQWADKQKGL